MKPSGSGDENAIRAILVPRGRDPFGQHRGSRPLAGSKFRVRDSRTSGRSAQSQCFFQNGGTVNDLFHEALNFGLKILGLGNISLKEKQYEVLKLLVVEKKDVLAVLPTGYGKSLIYQLLPPVLNNESRRKIYIFR